jgi:hypothetical protein
MANTEENNSHVPFRWVVAFAVLSGIAALFFILSLWKDYDREWRGYQRTYREMLASRGATAEERQEALRSGDRFEQIIVAGGERVDRCVMCHAGIEHPAFAGAPQPFAKHPAIPRHPFENFGCSLCHQGQGRATTVKDAHGEVAFWEEPLLRGSFIQASCGPCHVDSLKGAPLIQRGKQLYLMSGCIGCDERMHRLSQNQRSRGRGWPGFNLCGGTSKRPQLAHRPLQITAENLSRFDHAALWETAGQRPASPYRIRSELTSSTV